MAICSMRLANLSVFSVGRNRQSLTRDTVRELFPRGKHSEQTQSDPVIERFDHRLGVQIISPKVLGLGGRGLRRAKRAGLECVSNYDS